MLRLCDKVLKKQCVQYRLACRTVDGSHFVTHDPSDPSVN